MDPFWEPPIVCVGRHFPRGPYGAIFGTTRRMFGNWFSVVDPFGNAPVEPAGYVYPMRFATNQMIGTRPINAQWHWDRDLGVLGNWVLNLFIEFAIGPSLQMRLRAQILGGMFPRSADWTTNLGAGWRGSPLEFDLPLFFNGGGWGAGGPPAQLTVKVGQYDDMPNGRCVQL